MLDKLKFMSLLVVFLMNFEIQVLFYMKFYYFLSLNPYFISYLKLPTHLYLVNCYQLTVSFSMTPPSPLLVNVSFSLTLPPHFQLTLLMDSP